MWSLFGGGHSAATCDAEHKGFLKALYTGWKVRYDMVLDAIVLLGLRRMRTGCMLAVTNETRTCTIRYFVPSCGHYSVPYQAVRLVAQRSSNFLGS